MAVARESLSPIMRNINSRRLSLEMCQKIGNQLLSPLNSPHGFSQHKTQSPTVSSSTGFCHNNNSLHTPSNNQNKSPVASPYRRASVDQDVLRSFQGSPMSLCVNNNNNTTRRNSLTPLNNNIKNCQSLRIASFQRPSIPSINIQDTSNKADFCSHEKEKVEKVHRLRYSARYIENGGLFSTVIPPLIPSTPNKQNNNETSLFNPNPTQISKTSPNQQGRKHTISRFDFDDEFMNFVTSKCKLNLNPEVILGRGSFGTVIPGNYQGRDVAVKIIITKSAGHLESLKGEQNALDIPHHAHIAQVLDIFQVGPEKALIVMELLQKGNLLSLLNDCRVGLNFSTILRFSGQIATAIQFCHQNGILHLDVKPKNILLDWNYNCKLADFGTSKRSCDSFTPPSNLNKLEGTVAYKAPELFQGGTPTDKCDVYSFGICMWQILQRENPYEGQAEHQIIYQVIAQGLRPGKFTGQLKYNTNGTETQHSIPQYISTYESCWQENPLLRPDIKTVVEKLLLLLYYI